MIYVTGDTHGIHDISKLRSLDGTISRQDFLIICGDVGIYWDGSTHDEYVQDTLLSLVPCPILWVDGNHENFDLIEQLSIDQWAGGKVQITKGRIIHLMRGEIYTIEGKTFFCFGGGQSIDRMYRTEGQSWWRQEMPNYAEYENGLNNLAKHNNNVDYIITHTAPSFVCKQLVSDIYPGEESLQKYFTTVANTTEFDKWFFGHWHVDKIVDEKYFALYNYIETIG